MGLNVESNFITGNGALRIMWNTKKCKCLQELRIDNQRHIFGARVEEDFVRILNENKSIIRFGYQFGNPGFRMSAANCLTKNMDIVRKKRVQEQRMRVNSGGYGRKPKPQEKRQRKPPEQIDVREVLGDIKPHEIELLKNWFAAKMAEEKAAKQHKTVNYENDLN